MKRENSKLKNDRYQRRNTILLTSLFTLIILILLDILLATSNKKDNEKTKAESLSKTNKPSMKPFQKLSNFSMIALQKEESPISQSSNTEIGVKEQLSHQRAVNLSTVSNLCSKPLDVAYKMIDTSKGKGLEWCRNAKQKYRVDIGRSWGSLSKAMQLEWDKSHCNEVIATGQILSCDQRWGWKSFAEWLDTATVAITGKSTMICAKNLKTSTLCQFSNVVMDFSQAVAVGKSRNFYKGFLTTYGKVIAPSLDPGIPGRSHMNIPFGSDPNLKCDEEEIRPTFVLSNDDIYNLGHYYNDLVGIWALTVLAKRDTKQSLLINIDGVRAGGPSGGPAHRLMEPSDPDRHGPYVAYYKSWFNELKRGVDYGTKRVCFKELYFMPYPGIPWFWNDWGTVSECSTVSASPLYQSFNLFFRNRWKSQYGENSLADPDSGDIVHIVIEVRSINKQKRNNHSVARHISNLRELIDALQSIKNVRVTAQDFAMIPFSEQVSLSHSAGIFISMHGAGTTHIFHSALGKPNCCALIELQPDHSIGFQTAQGYGNIARMLGMHYYRYEASDGRTRREGTKVDAQQIKVLAEQAVDAVKKAPTCLHDVKDTVQPIDMLKSFKPE